MWSNSYISIPFLDHGRTRKGSDCWGLVRLIYKDRLNIDLPDYTISEYETTSDREGISKLYNSCKDEWIKVPLGEEKEYDVAVFRMMGLPAHVAIVTKPTVMIHCEKGRGTYVSDYVNDKEWSRRLEGFYRHARNSDIPTTLSS